MTEPVDTRGAAPSNMMQMIGRLIDSPTLDMDRLEKLLDMQERWEDRQREAEAAEAASDMSAELPLIPRKGKSHHGAYARWEDIAVTIQPLLARHGFHLSHRLEKRDGLVWVRAILKHRNGWVEQTELPAKPDDSGKKNPIQQEISSITYLKRATATALLGLAFEGDDDDGNGRARAPMNASQAKKSKLWEILSEEMGAECQTADECDEWLTKVKMYRESWSLMPDYWKSLFEEECFTPYKLKLPVTA